LKEAQKVYYPKENYKLYLKTGASPRGLGGILFMVEKMENIEKELQHIKKRRRRGDMLLF
jgi:hypothetical protein